MDGVYADSDAHDSTGRFIPYWCKDADGNIACEALAAYETEGDGDYYQLPKKTRQECIIDPYVYPVQGEDTLITSLVVPIIANDTFYGIAGIDLRLDFLQNLADDVEGLYDGTAKIVLVSNNGTLAGVTGQPELVGESMERVDANFQEDLKAIQAGEMLARTDEQGNLNTYVPIHVGRSTTPWSANILIPGAKITAQADAQMQKALDEMWRMIGIGIVCAIAALTLMWFVARSIAKPVVAMVGAMEEIADGDLSQRLKPTSNDEIGVMTNAMNSMADTLEAKSQLAGAIADGDLTEEVKLASDKDTLGIALQSMTDGLNSVIAQVNDTASRVNVGATQISDSSQSLSQGATEQAASLEEITSSMTEMGSQTRTNADSASQANQLTTTARDSAKKGAASMQEMVGAMNAINESSTEISKIIKTIDDIAFQTNLLALNAAVEAARAGQHGKGFAVVAEEVRNLAARSAKAAAETSELIASSGKKVENGMGIASQTAEALTEIVDGIAKAADLVGEIASASSEQAQGITQVNQGLGQIDSVTQQNTASAEETASASQELSSQSNQLRQLLTRFKLKCGSDIKTTTAASGAEQAVLDQAGHLSHEMSDAMKW